MIKEIKILAKTKQAAEKTAKAQFPFWRIKYVTKKKTSLKEYRVTMEQSIRRIKKR